MIKHSMSLKVLILPVSLAVVAVAAIFFIQPVFSEMLAAKNSLDTQKKQLEDLKIQNQKLQELEQKWQTMSEEKTLVRAALPETEDVDAYISELFSKASRSGVLLSKVQLGQLESKTDKPAYVCGAVNSADFSSIPAGSETANMPDAPNVSENCVRSINFSMTAVGTWEQILDFFKYLEDMNRISNIEGASIVSEKQSPDQPPSDLLSANVLINAFFKEKNQSGNAVLASAMSNQGNFNQKVIEKLKEIIYAPYSAPTMSPGGQRNVFK